MTPIQALKKLIDRADDLIAAIEGTTDQFETEVACLQAAVTKAEKVLEGGGSMTRDTILQGDCTNVMRRLASESVDFCLTDPPYLCNYRSRDGHTVRNDRTGEWLYPAFRQIHRLLKPNAFCVSFYGWHKVDEFMAAWRRAGFKPVGHIVFQKRYASSTRFMQARHEQAYLLLKGEPTMPEQPIPDVLPWDYTGNRLHPMQKPVGSLKPLIEAFCPAGGLVLDPFAGSGSTLVAARETGRAFIGIELDRRHWATAVRRLKTIRRSGDFTEVREAA